MRAIVTVAGRDQVGIIYQVSGVLAACGANILDINQTVMQDVFTMVMMVDLDPLRVPFTDLKDQLDRKGGELGLSIRVQREEIFQAMHRI